MENIKLIFDKRKLDTLIRLGVPDSALLALLKTGVAPKTEDALINDYLKSVLVVKKFKKNWGGKRDNSGKKQRNSAVSSFQDEKQLENQLDCQVVDRDIDKYKDKDILENKGGAGGKENLSNRGKMSITPLLDMNNSSCSDVVPPEGEGKGGGERKGKGKSKEIDLSFLADSFLKETFERFLAYRKEIKKPYKSQMAVEQAFKKLTKLSGGVLEKAENVVNQTIENQWEGLFPLKEENRGIKQPKTMAELYAEATNW